MADAHTSRYVIFGFGLGVAMTLGLLYLLLIQVPGVLSLLIWCMTAAIFVGLAGGGTVHEDDQCGVGGGGR